MGCSTLKNFNLPILKNIQAPLIYKSYEPIFSRFKVPTYTYLKHHRKIIVCSFGQKIQIKRHISFMLPETLVGALYYQRYSLFTIFFSSKDLGPLFILTLRRIQCKIMSLLREEKV